MDCMKMTGVSKAYQNGSEKLYALRDVNLVIEEGTFTAVMGRSGSGKTTLLNMMGALDQPTQGQVLFLGKDLGAMQEKELAALRRREIGFVFQKYQLLEEYDLWDNICVPTTGNRTGPTWKKFSRYSDFRNESMPFPASFPAASSSG